MTNKNYKTYKKHRAEIFDIIYDLWLRAPKPDALVFLFGFDTTEDEEIYNKKITEYLKTEEPVIQEKFRALGFENI